MKKLLKTLGIIVGLFLIICIIGYVAISSFLTPGNLRKIVERMVTETINYPVEIGSVSLKIGFKISININKLSIQNPKGFSTNRMISIENINFNLKLLPLFKRQVVINSITIEGTRIRVEKNKDGQFNIVLPTFPQKEDKGWNLALNAIDITKTNISYYDATTNTGFDVSDLKQSIKLKGNFIFAEGEQIFSVLPLKNFPELIIKVKNKVEYDTLTKNINIKEIKVNYDPIETRIYGIIEKSELLNLNADLWIYDLTKLMPLIPSESKPQRLTGSIKMDATILGTTKEPKVNGKCEMRNITVRPKGFNRDIEKINGSFSFDLNSIKNIIVQGILATSRFDISGSISNFKNPVLDILVKIACNLKDIETISEQTQGIRLDGIANLNVSIKGNANKPNYFGDYTLQNGTIDGIGLAKPITNLRIKGTIQNDGAKISECSGHIGRSDFSLSGYVSNFKMPVFQINNNSNLIDLDELFPKTKQVKRAEQKGIPVTIQGNIKINRLIGMDMEFKKISTGFNYENGIIDLKGCNAETFDGKVQFDFYYNSNSPEPYRINTRMENINAQKILKRFLKFENLQGRLTGVNNFQGRGFEQKQVITNLNASGNVKIINGAFTNFEFLNRLFEWMGLKETKTIILKDIVCSYKIENGRASIEDWSMQTGIGNFLVDGMIRLDGVINLNITLTLNKKESDLLKQYHTEWLLYYDPQGRATIDIIASGKLLSPQFRLDTNKMKERLKGKIKDEFDKKKKELEKKLKDLFRK